MGNGAGGDDQANRLRAAGVAADCAPGGAVGPVLACPPGAATPALGPGPPPTPTPTPAAAQLVVIVRTFLGDPISGVSVDAAGRNAVTGGDGKADFGVTAPGTYNVVARKDGFGPKPGGAGLWQVGSGKASATVTAGKTTTQVIQMAKVESLIVSHTPVNPVNPVRIYKGARGDAHVDHEIVATVKVPKAAGAGAGTQIPVRVDWTFTADADNAPKAKGGKDDTSIHFKASAGFAASGDLKKTASTNTKDSGVTKITFRASVTSGDKFTIHAQVLKDPANPGGGDWAHGDSPTFEVWKKLVYANIYRMVTGADKGVDVTTLCKEENIQPAYTPAFTEYTQGATHEIPFKEFLRPLVAPTAAQLPINSKVRVRSDGADTRQVTISGLVVGADGSAAADTDVLTLAGGTNVVSAKKFQRVDRAAVAADPARTVTVEGAGGTPIGTVAASADSADLGKFLFDTEAAVQPKAQAWADANEATEDAALNHLRTSIGAVGFHLVGCGWQHPKHAGAHSVETHFYTGYPGIHIAIAGSDFHPDKKWNGFDGVNSGHMSILNLNVLDAHPLGGDYTKGVARHEIGHSSDHTDFGPGDHCPQAADVCLMNASSTGGDFCTIDPDHSLHKAMGWT